MGQYRIVYSLVIPETRAQFTQDSDGPPIDMNSHQLLFDMQLIRFTLQHAE